MCALAIYPPFPQILKDCASKVGKFKDKLDERKHVEREQTAVNELSKQHEAERKAAMEEFDKQRKKALEEAAKQKKMHEASVKMMVKDMETLKADFKTRSAKVCMMRGLVAMNAPETLEVSAESDTPGAFFPRRVDEFNGTVKKLESRGGSAVDDLRKKHEKEMAEHTRDWNKKYNEMLKERLDAEEELRVEMEKFVEKTKKDAELDLKRRLKVAEGEMKEKFDQEAAMDQQRVCSPRGRGLDS